MENLDTLGKEALVRKLLEMIVGQDRLNAPSMAETPNRVVRFYHEFLRRPDIRFKLFEEKQCEDMLVQDGISVRSLCEHHLLPFFGTATVAYIPNNKVCGLSKLARVVQYFAADFQIQERLTSQVADFLYNFPDFNPTGVGVSLRCVHTCMTVRGVCEPLAVTTTTALRGVFNSQSTKEEFLSRISHPSFLP